MKVRGMFKIKMNSACPEGQIFLFPVVVVDLSKESDRRKIGVIRLKDREDDGVELRFDVGCDRWPGGQD